VQEGVLSSNNFVLMQLQKGKRYFCLATEWVLCRMQVLAAFSTRLIALSSVPTFTNSLTDIHVSIIHVCRCVQTMNVVSHGEHSKTTNPFI
jgi:hypothetical protein